MANQLTVTAKTGPAVQDTGLVLTNLALITFDMAALMLFTRDNSGVNKQWSLSGVTTVTCTVSGTSFTWVVS